MKIEELKPGMKVMGGQYKLIYEITEITGDTCTVIYDTGEKRMHGGKWIKYALIVIIVICGRNMARLSGIAKSTVCPWNGSPGVE